MTRREMLQQSFRDLSQGLLPLLGMAGGWWDFRKKMGQEIVPQQAACFPQAPVEPAFASQPKQDQQEKGG